MKLLMVVTALVALCPLNATAAGAAGGNTKEDRQALITMHEKMVKAHQAAADCLKAGKPVDECNAEAMKLCPMANTSECPFMKGGMKGMKTMKGMQDMKGMHGMGGDQSQDMNK